MLDHVIGPGDRMASSYINQVNKKTKLYLLSEVKCYKGKKVTLL